jgi:hypothetical protein
MSEGRYLEIVPDPELRTALSGMLGRRFWDIASEAIWEAMLAAEDGWTEVWPVEPGRYWFYRWRWKYPRREPEMILVKVYRTMSSIAYVGDGHFIYAGAFGLWKKAVLPEPPDLSGELAQSSGGEPGVVRAGG